MPQQQIIDLANSIIFEYAQKGFILTLRQLYYQFVARGYIANKQSEYSRLGDIVNNARLAGMMDWNAIEDRSRFVRQSTHWSNPGAIVESAADQYRIDRWADQSTRVEVWIEKDALVGVIERVCDEWSVPLLSCRGYVSQSEMWRAAMRYNDHFIEGYDCVLIHLGDHDPSGIDMSRDIRDRLDLFGQAQVDVRRIALNYDQVQRYKPPPNPAKMTDSRFNEYRFKYGTKSWELDALEPTELVDLVDAEIRSCLDPITWEKTMERENQHKAQLQEVAHNWDNVVTGRKWK